MVRNAHGRGGDKKTKLALQEEFPKIQSLKEVELLGNNRTDTNFMANCLAFIILIRENY